MKEKLTLLATTALLVAFGLSLSGCMTTGNDKMMDNSMPAQTEKMENNTMHDTMHQDTMSGSMDTMKKKDMEKKMDAPMENMDNGGMQSDMSGSMK